MLSTCLFSSSTGKREAQLQSFDSCDQFTDALNGFLKDAPLFLTSDYFSALEEAHIPGLSFKYIVLMNGKNIQGLYYFQVLNVASRELGSIIHIEPYAKIVNSFSLIINKLLFGVKKDQPHYLLNCGNMCLSGDFGIFAGKNTNPEVYEALPTILKSVITELEKSGKVIATVVKDFIQKNELPGTFLIANKFNLVVLDPIMKVLLDPSWKSFMDYQDALSAKYRLRLNNARKKIADLSVRDLNLNEIKQYREQINELYKAVQQKSPVTLAKPDVNYLISLSNSLKSKFRFRAYFSGDKMVAFMTGILNGNECEAHHIGIDYTFNKSHSIYLNILYEMIEMAIESGAKSLSYGRTALEMKTTVGAVAFNYNGYLKMNNSVVNKVVSHFLPVTPPDDWTPRNPFKNPIPVSPLI